MALRRPPTRIELKADDVEEYDKDFYARCFADSLDYRPYVHSSGGLALFSSSSSDDDRRLAAERHAMSEKNQQQQQQRRPGSDLAETPSPFVSSRKKPSAAERIGYRKSSR
ncbi:hypothetical protein ACHAW5_005002 [Stephanodiscus triporus]|uniref:Anaphase-promoting complex subunit CDC26 n=1 Tax=Stephanodiscus triporus TaxID=2934178 RepID=A0ABD3P3R6_9STRA